MTRKRWIVGGLILAALLISYSAGRESDSTPTAATSPTPEPTLEPTPTASPKATDRSVATPKATPRPVPGGITRPPGVMSYFDWLGHQIAVMDEVIPEMERFGETDAGSSGETDAALALYILWADEQTYIADTIPSICWFPVFEAWDQLVTSEYAKWDVVTDQIIAGTGIDYDVLTDTTDLDAVTAAMDVVDETTCQ